mgnify:CR=1 FL=1
MADYLALHLLIYGAVQLAILWRLRGRTGWPALPAEPHIDGKVAFLVDGGTIGEAEAVRDGHDGAGRAMLADREGRYRFLLDGFDELQSKDDRRRVADWLSAELEVWPQADFVVTTRRAAASAR